MSKSFTSSIRVTLLIFKTYAKSTVSILLLILVCISVFGQHKPKLELFINTYISKNINDDVYLNAKKGTTYFYALAFSFDQKGQIDTLYYSAKLSSTIKHLFKVSNLLKDIKAKKVQYKEYAGRTIVIPFYHYNASDNFVDYDSGFLTNLENMMPETIYNKPVIIFKPIINPYLRHVN